MRKTYGRIKAILMALCLLAAAEAYVVPGMAATEKKADLGAINGFGKNQTIDDKGNFEIEGVMVSKGSIYNVTVDGDNLQAWCGKMKGRTWFGQELIDLLDDKDTFFYDNVKGSKRSSEYGNKVEFTRPCGESW